MIHATTPFYCIDDNSLFVRNFPWIERIVSGFEERQVCKTCKRGIDYSTGEMTVALDPVQGSEWPDILGCGHYPFFIVSGRAGKYFDVEKKFVNKVRIQRPFSKRLPDMPPDYYWIDGKKIKDAQVNFDASGFVGVKFCPECGTQSHDIKATFERQRSGFSWVFHQSSWGGRNLFTTDISPTRFFCTEVVAACIKARELTNFRLTPIEKGDGLNRITP